MYERRYGVKYDKNLSVTEIAAAIRKDIKEAVKKGVLPAIKVSVRSRRYSGGQSIDVEIKALPEGLLIYNEARLVAEVQHGGSTGAPWASDKARALLDNVDAIRRAYNYDGSDTQSDYFDVNYYGSTDFAPELSSPEWDRRLKEVREKLAAGYTFGELGGWRAPDAPQLARVLPFPRLPNGDIDEDAVVAPEAACEFGCLTCRDKQ